jgi:hypothetical protein
MSSCDEPGETNCKDQLQKIGSTRGISCEISGFQILRINSSFYLISADMTLLLFETKKSKAVLLMSKHHGTLI